MRARATLLASDRIWTGSGPVGPGWIEVGDGRILAVGRGAPPRAADVDLTGRLVVPGFVDIHNHGGGGASFQTGDAGDVATAAALHRRHGTTTMLASLVSAPVGDLVETIAALAPLVAAGTVAGVHLEGPFLSVARCGAHPPRHLRPPRPGDVERLLSAGAGVVCMMTVAPELDGGLAAVRRLVAAGVVAAIGHTDASYEVARAAIDAGATVATHLCNAMRPIHHRDPGAVLACLDDDRMAVELIADGVHLHDAILRRLATAAGPGRTILVTDAIAAAGAGDAIDAAGAGSGELQLGSQRVVVRDGQARLRPEGPPAGVPKREVPKRGDLPRLDPPDPGPLAGSVVTLDLALARAVRVGIPLVDALAAVTTTPAGAVGLSALAGTLAPGRRADLVVLDDLRVAAVMVAGSWIPPGWPAEGLGAT